MEIKKDILIPLGYGKYVRSDRIVALEPITENRGPQRRTLVFVEGQNDAMVASRSESTILNDLVLSTEELRANEALDLLERIYDNLKDVGPMLRKSIYKEAGLNLDQIEAKIKSLIERTMPDLIDEPSLFEDSD